MNTSIAVSMFVAVLAYTVCAETFKNILNLRSVAKRQSSEGHGQQEMCFTISHLKALKDQFASYIDTDRDERASRDEIRAYLQKYNPSTTEQQLESFINRRDKDGDGSVDFIPDYLLEVSAPEYDLNTAREWFRLEDTNQDGFVSLDELITIARKVGMSEEEAEQTATGYYMSADTNGDKRLSWTEYKQLFQPPV